MEIVPRTAWKARHPDGFTTAPLPAAECWLHHSATTAPPADAAFEVDAAAVRVLEQIGQDRFGGGISYTWLIPPSGRIFQGHSPGRQGAHTAGRNDRARAICLIGNYETTAPTDAQLRSAAWLLQHAKAMGWLKTAQLTGGHRDVSQTACPGRHAYARIADINRLADGQPITVEDDVSVTDLVNFRPATGPDAAPRNLWDSASQLLHNVVRVEAKLDAMAGELRDDEADIIAAVRSIVTADQDPELVISDAQVHRLGEMLAAALPAGVTEAQVQEAVRRAFARAGE